MSPPPLSRIDAAESSPPRPVRSSNVVRAANAVRPTNVARQENQDSVGATEASTSQDFPIAAEGLAPHCQNVAPYFDALADAPFPPASDPSAALDPALAASAHREELVARLTGMIDQLDRRESQLNSRIAIHEHRERMFRRQVNDWRVSQAEAESDLERRRRELQTQARRIAFENRAVNENADVNRRQ